MKCPNCNAEIFEGDNFCGECGYNLSNSEEEGSTINESENNAQYDQEDRTTNNQNGEQAKVYFTEMLSFSKKAILSPGKAIGHTYNYNISVVAGAVGLLLILSSLITFIQMRSAFGEVAISFSTFFEIIIAAAILFGVFFGITYLMLMIVVKQNRHWKNVFNDFSIPVVIVYSLFILAALLNLITLYEIGLLVSFIGFLLFITTPIYILLRYSENTNVKFDSFYAIIVYYVLVSIVFYIIGRLALTVFIENFLYEFENMMMF